MGTSTLRQQPSLGGDVADFALDDRALHPHALARAALLSRFREQRARAFGLAVLELELERGEPDVLALRVGDERLFQDVARARDVPGEPPLFRRHQPQDLRLRATLHRALQHLVHRRDIPRGLLQRRRAHPQPLLRRESRRRVRVNRARRLEAPSLDALLRVRFPRPLSVLVLHPDADRDADDLFARLRRGRCSRSMETPCEPSDFTARSRILPTLFAFPLASSNFAAVIQIAGSVGSVSRALFKTFLDCSYDSRRASASHRSTCCGQHSTARARSILASSSLDKSTTAFHSLTEFGMFSSARRNTRRFLSSSVSNCAAAIQIFTLCGSDATPRASTAFAFSGVFKRAASIHTSSLFGHASHPRWMKLRAA
eukprot:31275-Pelagococcus_subviridis.AAC.14